MFTEAVAEVGEEADQRLADRPRADHMDNVRQRGSSFLSPR